MITDSAGNVENIIPKSVEDVMDKEIAAMSLEERAAVILALAGSWADRTDITLTDDRINPEGWDFEDLTDLYAPKLPL